jgi:hypothetical protein
MAGGYPAREHLLFHGASGDTRAEADNSIHSKQTPKVMAEQKAKSEPHFTSKMNVLIKNER